MRAMDGEGFEPISGERWAMISDYPDYWVSDRGRTLKMLRWHPKRPFRPKIINGGVNGSGYRTVNLRNASGPKTHFVHRLVAQHFLGAIPNGFHVNHKDGDKLNNHASNLEIVTPKQNVAHAVEIGLVTHDHLRGPLSFTKDKPYFFSFEEQREIRQRYERGEKGAPIARAMGLKEAAVQRFIRQLRVKMRRGLRIAA